MIDALRLKNQPNRNSGASMKSAEHAIARARAGDDEAFRLIFDRYARPVMSFIFDQIGSRELAEELTQETFVRAYRSLNSLRDDTKLSTWLFGIAKNVSRESLRTLRRNDDRVTMEESGAFEMKDSNPLPDGNLLNKELNGVIRTALEKLDEDKRAVFSLQAFQQCSYEEIAEITGFSIPKIKTDLHRAKAEMRRFIRPYMEACHEL